MALRFTTSCLEDSLTLFRYYKRLADGALAQIAGEQIYALIDPEANSIAIIMKHMIGNMLSRWTDFLSSDGEKPWRDRDAEFRDPPASREELMEQWEKGWSTMLGALEALTDADLKSTIYIRGEAHSVTQAIHRQLAHYAYHIGQIVLLAKHMQSENWKCLTIPKSKSEEFNRRVKAGEASQR